MREAREKTEAARSSITGGTGGEGGEGKDGEGREKNVMVTGEVVGRVVCTIDGISSRRVAT